MPLNGYPVTGEGETCTMEMAAQDPGTPLPLRPARAKANNASSWKGPEPVSPRSNEGGGPGEYGGITPT